MRKLLLAAYLLVGGCRKDMTVHSPAAPSTNGLSSVVAMLRNGLSPSDFSQLDTSVVLYSRHPGGTAMWRIAFKGLDITRDFVLVRIATAGSGTLGRIVHLENDDPGNPSSFMGSIRVSTLHRETILTSSITGGFVTVLHPELMSKVTVFGINTPFTLPESAGAQVLPEVVVVGYVTGSGSSTSDYIDYESLLDAAGGGYSSGGSGGGGAAGGGGGGSSSGTGSSAPYYDPVQPGAPQPPPGSIEQLVPATGVPLEPEYSDDITTVNLQSMFNCFNLVSSQGATYKIQICADVPINGQPTASVNSSAFSLGHSFIVMTKTNGAMSVSQSFGFYPGQTPSVFSPESAVPSATKDNGGQEINAGSSMAVTDAQFAYAQSVAIRQSGVAYRLTTYNCTDFALNVFNAARSTALTVPPYFVYIPNISSPAAGTVIVINSSPQALFAVLDAKKQAGGADAQNIVIDQTHGTKSPPSRGTCN
jgi:hypothetical protein